MRGSPSIDHSWLAGGSAQTAVITLSGWSGEIRGEIAVKLVLVALPLRPRLSFEIRGFCEAQSDAHSELTPTGGRDILCKQNISTCFRRNPCMEHDRFGRFIKNSPLFIRQTALVSPI
ncbi:hypothetical protein [Lapidilactobacillus achengensis]|uniref:hypothetical protein n=1 Tax=Lapidilactobacillus achengensis TaxID=2486000 RepID=UPI000F76A731|nr:hypothetical protein [Lapidilactobacillus achengensis]